MTFQKRLSYGDWEYKNIWNIYIFLNDSYNREMQIQYIYKNLY
jgi:hypothetical protein